MSFENFAEKKITHLMVYSLYFFSSKIEKKVKYILNLTTSHSTTSYQHFNSNECDVCNQRGFVLLLVHRYDQLHAIITYQLSNNKENHNKAITIYF